VPDASTILIAGGVVLGVATVAIALVRTASLLDDEQDAAQDQAAEHEGATEGWSPAAELEQFPRRPIGPDEAAAIAQAYEDALWEDQERAYKVAFYGLADDCRRGLDDTFERAARWSRRIGSGHLEKDTVEVSRDVIADLLAAGKRGAR
jgi:hypothetical protein